MRNCKGIKKDGSPCNSRAVKANGYCNFHDPSITPEERSAIARKGGSVKVYKGLVKKDFQKDLITDTRGVLVEVINLLRQGEMPPQTANSIIYASATLHRIWEAEEVERRLSEIEKIVEKDKV